MAPLSYLLIAAAASVTTALVCDPMAHGAVGDGSAYDTLAVRAAVDECGAAGGGTVLFAAGKVFLTGGFNVSSNTELQVEGTILGSPNATDYVLVDYLPWYGPNPPQALAGFDVDAREWSPLIQSWYASNVSITSPSGAGVIDGQGAAWWTCASNMSAFPCNGHARPHGVRLVGGYNFTVSGISLKDSPMWQLHLAYTTDVHVHDVSITAPASAGHNTDGIDPDCAQNVMIERVYISTGDDHIAIKSGRNWYGRTFGRASRNITVRDSVFGTGHGLSIGSEMSGGVHDVLFQNITMTGGACGPRIKSERGRGGSVTNVVYQDGHVYNVTSSCVQVTDNYDPGIPPTNKTATPVFSGITLVDVTCDGSAKGGWTLDGLPESEVMGLNLTRVALTNVKGAMFSTCDYVDTTSAVCVDVSPSCPPCVLPPV